MEKVMVKTAKQKVTKVLELVDEGLARWYEASLIVVDLIDNEGAGAVELLKRESKGLLNDPMIAAFERIGRKQLVPRLAYMPGPGPERLRRMPFSVQEKYLKEPIELLILKDDGTTDTLSVSVHDLTHKQAAQIFDGGCVRPLSGQRTYLEEERGRLSAAAKPVAAKTEAAKPVPEVPYRIIGRRVTFVQGCTLTRKELVQILAKMEG
jgi:hypothetical protein